MSESIKIEGLKVSSKEAAKIAPEESLTNVVRAAAQIPGITLQHALAKAFALPSAEADGYLRTEVRDLEGQVARLGCYFNAINELGRRNSEEENSLGEMDSLELRCARINAEIMSDRANKGLRIVSSNRAMMVPSLRSPWLYNRQSVGKRNVSKEVLAAYKGEVQPANKSAASLRENFNPFATKPVRVHPSKILPEVKVVSIAPSVAEELMGQQSPSIVKHVNA